MIITLSGDIGSGKSTTGKILAEQLKCKYLSTGAIQRQFADEMGLSTLQLNLLTEKRLDIDEKIDNYTRELNDAEESYVVDSRLAWHFIPKSFKIYLMCDVHIATQRISNDKSRLSDDQNLPAEELLQKIIDRRQSEKRRFLRIYGIDFEDLSNYDLVVDTALFRPDEIAVMICDAFNLHV